MKYLCMFVAFKIKTNKSEKGEIRKNLTIMKTGKTELPRSTSGADEFFILQGKKQGVTEFPDDIPLSLDPHSLFFSL